MVDGLEGEPSALPRCRWCGSALNNGFRYCPICHRHQGRMHGVVGPTSNWIAVVAAVLTFGQLLLSMEQSSDAKDAQISAENALKAVEVQRSDIEAIKGQVISVESSTTRVSHNISEMLLNIKTIESRVEEMGAARRAKIQRLTDTASAIRSRYTILQDTLAATPPTLEVKKTAPERTCGPMIPRLKGLKVKMECSWITVKTVVTETVPNEEYKTLQAEVEKASVELREAEEKLAQALAD